MPPPTGVRVYRTLREDMLTLEPDAKHVWVIYRARHEELHQQGWEYRDPLTPNLSPTSDWLVARQTRILSSQEFDGVVTALIIREPEHYRDAAVSAMESEIALRLSGGKIRSGPIGRAVDWIGAAVIGGGLELAACCDINSNGRFSRSFGKSSSLCRFSINPLTTVKGVRNSCETLATKSLRTRSCMTRSVISWASSSICPSP